MSHLVEHNFVEPILDWVKGKPLMEFASVFKQCLKSEETPDVEVLEFLRAKLNDLRSI